MSTRPLLLVATCSPELRDDAIEIFIEAAKRAGVALAIVTDDADGITSKLEPGNAAELARIIEGLSSVPEYERAQQAANVDATTSNGPTKIQPKKYVDHEDRAWRRNLEKEQRRFRGDRV